MTWALCGLLLLGACESRRTSSSVSPGFLEGGSRASAYRAGLREPRGLRTIRAPQPAASRGNRMLRSQPTVMGNRQSPVTYSPNGKKGSIRIGRTDYTWDQSSRTLILSSAITPAPVPHSTPTVNPALPNVRYDPVTDTWTWH